MKASIPRLETMNKGDFQMERKQDFGKKSIKMEMKSIINTVEKGLGPFVVMELGAMPLGGELAHGMVVSQNGSMKV